jgi:hypothetical protein
MFLVISGLVCANTYLVMPKDPGDQDKILQIWLQARPPVPPQYSRLPMDRWVPPCGALHRCAHSPEV